MADTNQSRNPLKHLKRAHSIHHAKVLANRHASRLRQAREPRTAMASILEAHADDPLEKVKFRDVESLVERTALMPTTTTLEELKLQSCTLFLFKMDRAADVRLTYPNEGIRNYDNSEDSRSTTLAAEEDWAAAKREWDAGSWSRRDIALVSATHVAARDIRSSTRPSEVNSINEKNLKETRL